MRKMFRFVERAHSPLNYSLASSNAFATNDEFTFCYGHQTIIQIFKSIYFYKYFLLCYDP